jgi:ribonuclease BN (tRNA processing enzyme)
MELTVLGCWGGYPRAGEASSGYLLEQDGFHLLIDCGSAVLSKLQMIMPPEKLDAVLLSHYHPDHVADIGVLQHALYVGKYIHQYSGCLPVYGHGKDRDEFERLSYKDVMKGIGYNGDETLQIGPFSVSFLRTKHSVPCFATRIETAGKTLVYTGDTAFFEELASFSRDAHVLLAESNFYKGMDGKAAGHMTSEEAGRIAEEAKAKKLILTHLPHFGDLEQLKAEAGEPFGGDILIAKEGLAITIQ